MVSMSISLPDPLREWVQRQIESGDYASASDYVRDLIRRDQASARQNQTMLALLDKAVAQSLADEEAGALTEGDQLFDRLEARYATARP